MTKEGEKMLKGGSSSSVPLPGGGGSICEGYEYVNRPIRDRYVP